MLKIEAQQYRVTLARMNYAFMGRDSIHFREEIIITGRQVDIEDSETWQVFLFFLDNIESAPDNFMSMLGTVRRVFIFMSLEQFDKTLDLLRNEKPVFVVYNDKMPNYAGISTGSEPVGEGENKCCAPAAVENPIGSEPDQTQPAQTYAYDHLQLTSATHHWQNSYLLALASYYIYGDWMPGNNDGNVFQTALNERFSPLVRPDMTVTLISDGGLLRLTTGLQAMVISNDDFIVIAFRGTQMDVHDWAVNFTNLAAPTPVSWAPFGAMTHPGFLVSLDLNYEAIINAVRSQRSSSTQPLFITGHSLGGALSTIAALRITLMNDHEVSGVYTYGSPPVAFGTFTQVYDEAELGAITQRWVNHRDWAPGLPLPGYGHVGRPNFIGIDGVAHLGMPPTPYILPEFSDHKILNYLSLIENNLPSEIQNVMPAVIV